MKRAPERKKKNAPRPAGRVRGQDVGRIRHRHRDALAAAARRLRERPYAHAMAMLLLAVGLLAVALITIAAGRLAHLATPMSGAHSLSLFLAPDIDAARADTLARALQGDDRVTAVERISPEAGLAELTQVEGASQALEALADNPLPWVLSVEPVDRAAGAALAEQWRQRPEVDHVADEGEWLARADAAFAASRTLALLLAMLVLAALVMVAANAIRTIRVEGASERALQRVFGATEADLRRPYLYLGALYGLIAALLACLAACGVLLVVQPALIAVAQLLDQPAGDATATWLPLLAMVPAAALFGWVGAWFGCVFEPDLEASE